MGRKRQQRELSVAMNGLLVGEWTRLPAGEQQFRYAPSWLEQLQAVPISLSMPLSRDAFRGDVVRNYFDNLLPDSTETRRRSEGQLGATSDQPFDLLESMGRDCVGALQIYPKGELQADVRRIDATPVSDEWIASTLRSYETQPLGM